MEKIISEKKGILLSDIKDVNALTEVSVKCCNGHVFKLFMNDILVDDKWCEDCIGNSQISNIERCLRELKIDYTLTSKSIKIDYLGRKIIITNDPSEKVNSYIMVPYDENFCKDFVKLKTSMWNGFLRNSSFSLTEKILRPVSFFSEKKSLGNTKGDTGSFVKYNKEYTGQFKRALGYLRVSTDMQVRDGFSLENQEIEICRYAENENMELEALYIDEGLTGTEMSARLALQEMMKDCSPGTTVIVKAIARISRKTLDLIKLAEEIKSKQCKFVCIELNIDFASPIGALLLTLSGSLAQFEAQVISERIKSVLKTMKEKGTLRKRPLYGYKINEDKDSDIHYLPIEEEQINIQKIRNIVEKNKNKGITRIVRIINDKIPPPRKAKQWYLKSVKNLCIRECINLN